MSLLIRQCSVNKMQMISKPEIVGQRGCVQRKAPAIAKGRYTPVVRRSAIRMRAVSTEEKVLVEQAKESSSAVKDAVKRDVLPKLNSLGKPDILPLMWEETASKFGDLLASEDPHRIPGQILKTTHRQLAANMKQLAAGMNAMGLKQGDRASLFAENSSRWIVCDQACMMNGAVAAVRGSSAPLEELAYISNHSESVAWMLHDAAALQKMAPELKRDCSKMKFILVIWGEVDAIKEECKKLELPDSLKVVTFDQVMAMGADKGSFEIASPDPDSLATLCYTSGTTGHPKAVMLSHSNLMYQVRTLSSAVPIKKGETCMSLLPPWHIYERTAGYFMLAHGLRQVHTTIPKFGQDLAKYKPDHFVCVPLVLDTLHGRIMSKLKSTPGIKGKIAMTLVAASITYVRNKRIADGLALQHATKEAARSIGTYLMALITSVLLTPLYGLAQKIVFGKVREAVGVQQSIICGGGSLAPHLDDFMEALGINLLNGWGLTETSPVLACRGYAEGLYNVRGTTGKAMVGTELRVVDPDTLKDVPDGTKGLIVAKGPGVMKGYLNDEESTAKAFKAGPGWFDTGDLGLKIAEGVPGAEKMAGYFVLTGRAKDTIVMSTGKNVEPEPIENKICVSPIIKHIILIGQDKRDLGALVFPDFEGLKLMAKEAEAKGEKAEGAAASSSQDKEIPHTPEELHELFKKEVIRLNKARGDYHSYENIVHVAVMDKPLSVEDGTLTRTMKPRRPEIYKVYAKEVASMEAELR